jgi:hypothetical protein
MNSVRNNINAVATQNTVLSGSMTPHTPVLIATAVHNATSAPRELDADNPDRMANDLWSRTTAQLCFLNAQPCDISLTDISNQGSPRIGCRFEVGWTTEQST